MGFSIRTYNWYNSGPNCIIFNQTIYRGEIYRDIWPAFRRPLEATQAIQPATFVPADPRGPPKKWMVNTC